MQPHLTCILALILLVLIIWYKEEEEELVLYSMDNCPHCQTFYPTWLSVKSKNIVKCREVRNRMCLKEGIQHTPTVRYYRGDKYKELIGNVSEEILIEFVEKSRR